MGSENDNGCTQNIENGFGVDFFFELYNKDGNEFLNHIIWVTGHETWISFVNIETVKAVDAHTFTRQAEKV
jgi:hypothetical protein